MRLIREPLSSPTTSLAEIDRNSESGGSGRDVDGCAACEIEPATDEDPSFRVPCPAGDGIVNKGAPYEDKDEERAEARALSDSSNSEDWAANFDFDYNSNSMGVFRKAVRGKARRAPEKEME